MYLFGNFDKSLSNIIYLENGYENISKFGSMYVMLIGM